MPDVATDQCPRRNPRHGDSVLVQAELLRLGSEEFNGVGSHVHQLEVVVSHVIDEGIVDRGKGNSLGMIPAQHAAPTEATLVPCPKTTAMKENHQRRGAVGIDGPKVENATVVLLAVSKIAVSRL